MHHLNIDKLVSRPSSDSQKHVKGIGLLLIYLRPLAQLVEADAKLSELLPARKLKKLKAEVFLSFVAPSRGCQQ